MKTKLVKLPAKLTIAIGQYYINRNLSKPRVIATTYYRGKKIDETLKDGKPWDKSASLKLIEESTSFGWEAIAGTFWFYKPSVKNKRYMVNENTWPLAEVEKIK
jgi:hypothetical protein